jgi:hypothetical protein
LTIEIGRCVEVKARLPAWECAFNRMSSGEKNRYWIPNLDINKKVITQEILYYLGPESTVRPSTREVLHLLISIRNAY